MSDELAKKNDVQVSVAKETLLRAFQSRIIARDQAKAGVPVRQAPVGVTKRDGEDVFVAATTDPDLAEEWQRKIDAGARFEVQVHREPTNDELDELSRQLPPPPPPRALPPAKGAVLPPMEADSAVRRVTLGGEVRVVERVDACGRCHHPAHGGPCIVVCDVDGRPAPCGCGGLPPLRGTPRAGEPAMAASLHTPPGKPFRVEVRDESGAVVAASPYFPSVMPAVQWAHAWTDKRANQGFRATVRVFNGTTVEREYPRPRAALGARIV
jgi:hypothetical protein